MKDVRTPIATNGGQWVEKFGARWGAQAEALRVKFGSAIEQVRMPPTDPTDVPVVFVMAERLVEVLGWMKTQSGFEYDTLSDITATDEGLGGVGSSGGPFRFEVVYQLFSSTALNRIRVKVRVPATGADGAGEIPSVVSLWEGANWAEREVFDMYGVKFKGHPDLRRILMDARWEGHPLRKDYPLRGYQVFTEPEDPEAGLLN